MSPGTNPISSSWRALSFDRAFRVMRASFHEIREPNAIFIYFDTMVGVGATFTRCNLSITVILKLSISINLVTCV
mgnify:FL=1